LKVRFPKQGGVRLAVAAAATATAMPIGRTLELLATQRPPIYDN